MRAVRIEKREIKIKSIRVTRKIKKHFVSLIHASELHDKVKIILPFAAWYEKISKKIYSLQKNPFLLNLKSWKKYEEANKPTY